MITKHLLTPVALLAMVLSGSALANGNVGSDKAFRRANGDRSIFIRMDHGDKVRISKNGPLEVFAQCDSDFFGGAMIKITATTTEVPMNTTDGTWTTRGVQISPNDSAVLLEQNISEGNLFTVGPAGIMSQSGRSVSFAPGMLVGVGIQGALCTISGEIVNARERKWKHKHRKHKHRKYKRHKKHD